MIADTPFLAGLASGVDRVIPETGDGQVIIPSILSPVILPIIFHSSAVASTDRCTTSKLAETAVLRLNQAALITDIIVLPKGYYCLQFNLAARANFATAVLDEIVKLSILYQGILVTLASLFLNVETANVDGRRDILIIDDATIQLEVPPTNALATNSIAVNLGLNVIRRV